jgi:anti-anti-sigma factor
MAKKTAKRTSTLRLEGALDVQHAGDLQAMLLGHIGQASGGLTVDLTEVTTCDSAGLQLLCAARKSAHASGHQWRLANPSEPFLRASTEMGLDLQELGL